MDIDAGEHGMRRSLLCGALVSCYLPLPGCRRIDRKAVMVEEESEAMTRVDIVVSRGATRRESGIVKRALSGATAADVVAGQLAAAISQAPTLVTLAVGPNDFLTQREVTAFARDLEPLCRTVRTATAAGLVVNLLPDLTVTPRSRADPAAVRGQQIEAFNAALRRSARAYGAVGVARHSPSRVEVPRRPALVAADG